MVSTDRDALVALYNATGGANWKNKAKWDTDAALSQWYGVKVNDQDRVVELELEGNNLTGPIPPELGNVRELHTLWLNNNQLTGPIPAELGNLRKLQLLALDNNQLTGHIPQQLGNLSALKSFNLSRNKLDGPIPPELGKLTALTDLSLWGNPLTGAIPAQLGALSKLTVLTLLSNQLSGRIPKELGALSKLAKLDISRNQLTGPIPPELGNLAALQYLRLSSNQLSGHIPPQLGDLGALTYLSLGSNKLDGHIPPQLGDLGALEYLDLSRNELDGHIPKELGALTKLEMLWLYQNQISGPIPWSLGALSELTELLLYKNRLSGHIPKGLGNLGKLRYLYLQDNLLTAFWDHTSGAACDEELLQGYAGGAARPKQLGKLLASLCEIEDTNYLNISNNPWEEPPEAVVEKGMSAVSQYFADLFAEGVTVRRSMIKVVIVGQEGAGKTSLRQSIRNRWPTPTSGSAGSTVQIDVEEIDVDGVSLRFYDCAGQVAYTGLLQMFLSPRAVTLLVCNTGAFGQRGACSSDEYQLKQDLNKLQELRVCDWLRSLSFRIPDSDVIVVASKCDLAGGMAADVAGRMERAIQKWLQTWSGASMTAVRVEDGVSLTSCNSSAPEEPGDGALGKRKSPGESKWACDWREDMLDESSPSLLRRLVNNRHGGLRGATMVLPKSWNIALEVLDALGSGRNPVKSVLQMTLAADGSAGGKGAAAATLKQQEGIDGVSTEGLFAKWTEVVEALKEHGVNVINRDHALEGALTIREHQGSLVRHKTYVFLDVTWLAKILKPLLNHKDDEDQLDGSLSLGDTDITLVGDKDIASWNRLKAEGVLETVLARVLWPDGLSDYVLPTLDALGLTHPLDGDSAEGLVVLLRLGEERPADVGKELDDFRRDHIAVLSVTWKVFLGVPPGAIEKVLTQCCRIGVLRTFWRKGVLVQGGLGGGIADKTFALLIEYLHETTEIDIKVYGNIGTAAPWAALSLGVSAVRTMCSDFPGLRWRAYLKCPQHGQNMQINRMGTRPGDKLLLGKTCSLCRSETGGIGAAATDLLEMVDIHQGGGEIFRELHRRFVELQDWYTVLCPKKSQGLYPEQAQRRFDEWLSGMKQEAEGFLHGAKGFTDGEGVGEVTKAGGRDGVSGITGEMAKLERLCGDLKHQLEQQHQDVRVWLGAVDKRLEDVIDADAGAMEQRDFLVAMLMAVRSEGCDTPRKACILPPWKFAEAHGLSEDEQAPEVWVKRFDEWRADDFKQGKGVFTKRKRLFLVCAHTHRLVPCGPNGQGYDLQQPRTWFRMSVSVATFALQVVCATLAAIAVAPLTGLGAAVETTVSAAMGRLEAKLEGLTLGDDGTDVEVVPQTAQLESGAYASLREFIHGVEDTARLEIAKAERGRGAPPSPSEFIFFSQKMSQVQKRNGDAAVQWVLMGQEDAWQNSIKSAPIA